MSKKIKFFITAFILASMSCSSFSEASILNFWKTEKKKPAIQPRISMKDVSPDSIVKPVKSVSSLTLADCYYLALKQSENISIDIDKIKVTEAHFLQALSIVLPHVSFVSTDTQEEKTSSSTLSSLSPTTSSERKFNTQQTLFNGFKAFAAIKGSTAERNQRLNELKRAEQLLLVDVSDSFYLLLEKREDIKAIERTRQALIGRVKELKDRERIGRSRPSEVVNAKTQLYNVEASLEVSKSQEDIARQLLEFLVGQPFGEIIDTYKLPPSLEPESYYVSKAEMRPDVEASKFAWELAKRESQMVDSDFLPTASLEYNHYTQRTGFNKGVDWDLMLKINVPIFDGAETIGRSDEARLQARESELTFMRTKRKAPYDIRESYIKLDTTIRVYKALRKSFNMAKLNYYLQRKDYGRSLVSNLDVLASIQTLQDVQRSYIHALYEAKRTNWYMKAAIGEDVTEALNDAI